MKYLLLATLLLLQSEVFAKNTTMYAVLKGGLSIYEYMDVKSKVMGKIPYGAKLLVDMEDVTSISIITEGFYGYWIEVTYNQVTGYVVNSYLFPMAPPKAGTKTMNAYLLQLSQPSGAPVTVKTGALDKYPGGGFSLKKQLYKNGTSHHGYSIFEFTSETWFLPGLDVKGAFLLVRLIPEFKDAFTDKDVFPVADTSYTRNDLDYNLTVDKQMMESEPWIKKIRIKFGRGVYNVLEITELDGEAAIYYSEEE